MNNYRFHVMAFVVLSVLSAAVFAQDGARASGMGLAFGGDAYVALQNWPDVGAPGDTKMGYGMGGSIGLGMQVDEMKLLLGPHLGLSRWSADYSKKPNSATDSIYVEMEDVGLQLTMIFDELVMSVGKGNSTISSGMMVNGKDIKYAYDGNSYPYSVVSVGLKADMLMFSIAAVSYQGYASYCNRVDFRLGIGF